MNAGVGLWMWDYVAIKRGAGATSPQTQDGQKCWVLPFCVDNKCVELDVAADWDRGDPLPRKSHEIRGPDHPSLIYTLGFL